MLTDTFLVILAADVVVIVVLLVGVAVVLLVGVAVVLFAGVAVVLLVVTVNVNHTFKIHDVILQEIDIVLKSYMYQSYNKMLTLVWLFTKLEENIFILGPMFDFALNWRSSTQLSEENYMQVDFK